MRFSVSVVITLQNGAEHADGLIASVLPQLSENDEIIVCGPEAVQAANGIEDDRIRIAEGAACSFSDAVAQCRNDIVFFSSENDVWASDKVETVLQVFDKHPSCTIVLHDMCSFQNDIAESGNDRPVRYKKGFNRSIIADPYKASCMAVRKSFLERMLPADEIQTPFSSILGLVSEKAGKTVYIPEKLTYQRISSDEPAAKASILKKNDQRRRMYCEYEVFEDSYYRSALPVNGPLDKLKNIAWIFMIIFFIDCCLFGAGRLIEFGYVSFRMLIFAAAFITSFPLVIKNLKRLLKNPILYFTLPFAPVLVIWAIYGYLRGNPFDFIWTDVTSCLTLALLPGILCVVDSEKKVMTLTNVIFYCAVILAAVSTFVQFIAVHIENAYKLSYYCYLHQLGGFNQLQSGTYRVFFSCSIFLQVGMMLGIWKIWHAQSLKKRLLNYFFEGLLIYAWLISYTRSFWIGMAASVLFVIVWQPRIVLKCCKAVVIPLLVAALIMCFSWLNEGGPYVFKELYNRVIITIEQYTGTKHGGSYRPEDVESQDIRTITKYAEIGRIKERPVVGRGLGAYLEGVRTEPRIEYTYLDVMMKTGSVGTFFFALAFLAFIVKAFAHRVFKPKNEPENSFYTLTTLILAAYLGIIAASATNPFLICPLGISYLLFTEAAVYNCRINTTAVV